jgi:hypothetical protein
VHLLANIVVVADFIHQEEMTTFRTYHFAPNVHDSTYRILFLEMDESQVATYNIANLDDYKAEEKEEEEEKKTKKKKKKKKKK